jgi:hypothetical protein
LPISRRAPAISKRIAVTAPTDQSSTVVLASENLETFAVERVGDDLCLILPAAHA